MRATQAGHGAIVFAWEAERQPHAHNNFLRSVAQTAARAVTQPAPQTVAKSPASPPRKKHQPIIGTIKLRSNESKTLPESTAGTNAPHRGSFRAPQFGGRGKTHG